MKNRHRAGRGLVLSSSLALVALAFASLAARPAVAALASSPWPIFQHDAQHTGRTPLLGPSGSILSPPPLAWKYRGFFKLRLLSQPTVGEDGTIYQGRAKHPLCAISPAGAEVWCTLQNNNGTFPDRSSPTVADNGMIYIGGRDNDLWALRPNGSIQWKYHVPTDGDVTTSPLIAQDGAVYMGSDSLQAGSFYRMVPGDPDPMHPNGGSTASYDWLTMLGGGIKNVSPAESHDGTRIYATINGTTVVAIDATSTGSYSELWRIELESAVKGARGPNYTPVVADDGKILVAFDFGVYAVNPNGTLCWHFNQNENNRFEAPPALGWDGRVFAAGYKGPRGKIFAIMPPVSCGSAPTLLWSHPLTGRLRNSAPVVDGNGDVYIGARKTVYKLDGDGDGMGNGSVIWEYTGAKGIYDATVMIPSAGRLLAPSYDGFLHAIGN